MSLLRSTSPPSANLCVHRLFRSPTVLHLKNFTALWFEPVVSYLEALFVVAALFTEVSLEGACNGL